jgi:hypothetical protein
LSQKKSAGVGLVAAIEYIRSSDLRAMAVRTIERCHPSR